MWQGRSSTGVDAQVDCGIAIDRLDPLSCIAITKHSINTLIQFHYIFFKAIPNKKMQNATFKKFGVSIEIKNTFIQQECIMEY